MAHLQVLKEIKSLRHGDVTIGLEHHHGQWATWKHVTNDELSNDVETDLPVGDRLNHSNWNEEDNWNQHADDECPPCHVSLPVQASGHSQCEQDDVESEVPPLWRVAVLAHHLQMDIGILVASQLVTLPDLATVVKRGVDDEGGDGGERHTVAECEVGGKEERTV